MATFYNNATLSYNGTVTNSNTTTGELLEVLSAAKTAVMDVYTANSGVTFVVTITNTGASPFTNLTVTDDLGAYTFGTQTLVPLTYTADSILYYVNGVLQPAPAVTAGPPLVFTGVSVPAGGNATLIYEAATNQFAPLGTGGVITHQSVVSGGGLTTAVTVTDSVTVQNAADLTISKSMNPTTVTENGLLTYTFVIQNSGNTAAAAGDNVTLTDTFNPILSNISVSFNGATWVPVSDYNYNSSTGVFTTVADQITVPAATYDQDPATGTWIVTPGVSILTVSGTV